MAIAIPLIMGAMGASTMVTALASVAFAVTGISAKINEAASSVFGSDLVGAANLFGTALGAAGGFGPIDAAAGAGDYVNAMDAASDAFTTAGTSGAGDFGSLADAAGKVSEAGDVANAADFGNEAASQAAGVTEMGGDSGNFNLAAKQASPTQTMGAGENPMDVANATQKPQSLIPGTGAAGTQAAGAQAAGVQAAGAQPAVAPQAAAPVATQATAAPKSFFEKLIYDKDGNVSTGAMRMGGQILGGVGQGYQAAQAAAEKKRQFDQQMSMYGQKTGVRATR